jgi:hypothetical protein
MVLNPGVKEHYCETNPANTLTKPVSQQIEQEETQHSPKDCGEPKRRQPGPKNIYGLHGNIVERKTKIVVGRESLFVLKGIVPNILEGQITQQIIAVGQSELLEDCLMFIIIKSGISEIISSYRHRYYYD